MKFPKEFDYWGGLTDLAKSIGVDQSSVGYWKRVNKVPRKHEGAVVQAVYQMRDQMNAEPAPEPAPEPEPKPLPPTDKVHLSDIVDMIADYMRERGL